MDSLAELRRTVQASSAWCRPQPAAELAGIFDSSTEAEPSDPFTVFGTVRWLSAALATSFGQQQPHSQRLPSARGSRILTASSPVFVSCCIGRKKYLIEQTSGEKILGRTKGFTVQACAEGVAVAADTLQYPPNRPSPSAPEEGRCQQVQRPECEACSLSTTQSRLQLFAEQPGLSSLA